MPKFLVIYKDYIKNIECDYLEIKDELDKLKNKDYLVLEDPSSAFGNNINKSISINQDTLTIAKNSNISILRSDYNSDIIIDSNLNIEDRNSLSSNFATNSLNLWKVSGDFLKYRDIYETLDAPVDGYYSDGYSTAHECHDGYSNQSLSYAKSNLFLYIYKHKLGSGSLIFESESPEENILVARNKYVVNISFENVHSGNKSEIYIKYANQKIRIHPFKKYSDFSTTIFAKNNSDFIGLEVESNSPSSFKILKFQVKKVIGKSDLYASGDIINTGNIKADKISEGAGSPFSIDSSFYSNLNIINDNGNLKIIDNNDDSIISDDSNMLNLTNLIMVMLKEILRLREG